MPKLEPKIIQKELEDGLIWPVYWLYGQERMKSRELLKRIRRVVLGDSIEPSAIQFAETVLDGKEVSGEEVVEAALSQSLGSLLTQSPNLVVVKDAHFLKNIETLSELFRPRAKKSELSHVCVLISKDLDGRKKFSKILVEKAAVVPCEEIAEADREAWIQYLMKRKNLQLSLPQVAYLTTLDPWNLDIVDQELEKYSLLQGDDPSLGQLPIEERFRSDDWIEAFFNRDLKQALKQVDHFAKQVEASLPLLGLLAWNTRYLAMAQADSGQGLRGLKVNPYFVERLHRWSKLWKLSEVLDLQTELAHLDFSLKQTPLVPLGVWSRLVMKFCHA